MKKFIPVCIAVFITALLSSQSVSAQCFASISAQNVTCNGLCNGSATGNPSIFRPGPFTYLWNTGATTQTITGLCPGPYSVLITDANNCTSTDNTTITQPNPITSSTTQTNVSCHGGTNGTARITVSGGGTYTYSWNTTPVQTTQTATGLSAGTYTVVATRTSTGCTTSSTVTITQPPAITGSISSTPALCTQATGTATASASGGTGALTYSWNTNPVQTTATATSLAPGTYTVTVKDANNCTISGNVTVESTGGPSLSFTTTPNVCNGGNNATATVTATGGTLPYTYSWDTNPVQTTATATGLSEGDYDVTVSDGGGCVTTQTYHVTDPVAISPNVTITDVLCANASNGAANAAPTGGQAPYTYSWDSWPVQTTQTASGLSHGVYNVTVTDANGCTVTEPVPVGAPEPLAITISGTDLTCNGAGDGTATAHPSGGTPGYAYAWNTNPVQTTQTAENLPAGTYTLTVTDTNGCSIVSTVGIGQPAGITVSTTSTNSACGQPTGSATVTASGGSGNFSYSWNTNPVQTTAAATGISAGTYTVTVTDNGSGCSVTANATVQNTGGMTTSTTHTNASCFEGANGTATVTASGGTPAYTYSWNTSPVQTTQTAFGLSAGTYTATVTDQAGCISTTTATITEPAELAVAVTSADILCFGSTTGSANSIASGGVPTYTYSWNTTPVQTTHNISGLDAGDYEVTVTDGQGCTVSATVTIAAPQAALSATAVHTNVSCADGSDGSATADALGGTSPYSYSWNTSPVQTTITALGLSAGTYTVTVTDFNGCVTTASTSITEPTALTIQTGSTQTSCSVGDGTAGVIATGGTPGYTYLWDTDPAQTTDTAIALSSGTYNVIVTDANGCIQSGNVTVSNQGGLDAQVTSSNVSCFGGNNGTAVITASGGAGGYSYSWNTNPVQTTATVTNLTASTYIATITDQAGCVFTATVVITELPQLTLSTTVQNITCNGAQDGAIGTTVGGGATPYTYVWNDAQTVDSISGLDAGEYIVIVTDDNGCTTSDTAIVTQPSSALSATVIHTNVSCNGGTNGAATANTFGGTTPYSYSWNTTPPQTTQTAITLPSGSYSVVITDANGCSLTRTVNISQPNAITMQVTHTDATCNQSDGTATAIATGGTGNLGYSWNTSPAQTASLATGLSAGNYTITVTDANGCSASQNVTLNNTGGPTLQVSSSDASCNGSDNGTITITPTGNGPFTYVWDTNPAQTTGTITGLAPGDYSVTVTDQNGCQSLETVSITEPTELTVSVSGTDPSCEGCSDGSITSTVTGGTPSYTYSWSFGPTTTSITNLPAGAYCVTVTDDHGCNAVACTTLTDPLPTGIINSIVSENSFVVYPNPTSGVVTIEFETAQLTRFTLSITNVLGENIISQQNEVNGSFKQLIDLSQVAEGMYFITVRSDNETLLRKVLKK